MSKKTKHIISSVYSLQQHGIVRIRLDDGTYVTPSDGKPGQAERRGKPCSLHSLNRDNYKNKPLLQDAAHRSHLSLNFTTRAAFLLLFLSLTTACTRQIGFWPAASGSDDEMPVNVVLHWNDGDVLPEHGMRVHVFPDDPSLQGFRSDIPSLGGKIWAPQAPEYTAVCYDYHGNENINFRNINDSETFEAYCVPMTNSYSTRVEPQLDEPTVAEPTPRTFYVSRDHLAAASEWHFYPENTLREFTFLIYGVEGAKHVFGSRGAISGMAASYFPATGRLSAEPTTILFGRTGIYSNGQKRRWTAEQKQDWPAGWQDPLTGWTGDWIMGSITTFGPADVERIANRLTIEVLTHASNYYYAFWDVSNQIAGASKKSTGKEQTNWRRQNGGFDIVVAADGKLTIPADPKDAINPGNHGFLVDTDEWETIEVNM